MKTPSLTTHLLARRLWRPLSRCYRRLVVPLLCVHQWLYRKAGQARGVQLFAHSSSGYDLAAIVASLTEPFACWNGRARERMKAETDPRLFRSATSDDRNGHHCPPHDH